MTTKKITLAIVDSHALIHRAYHALPPMNNSEGLPTQAVYGFTTMLLKMFTALKPTHVVATFDMKGPTFRHEEYAGYKAQRPLAPDDLIVQFELARDVARALNIPILEKQGFEADDIIGTLVKSFNHGVKKVIVTGDADALQLVDEDTSVFTLKRGVTETVLLTPELVKEKYGFEPKFVADYKGLKGDPSDNIPGVAGVGDKTAKELVSKYGTIEEIFAHLDELPKRAQTALKDHKEEALFSRKLAQIRCDVPIEFELPAAELSDFDVEAVRKIFERLGFKSLLARIPRSKRGETQPTLLKSDDGVPTVEVEMPENYHLVETREEAEALKRRLSGEKIIAFDTENDRLGAREYPIVGMSFAVREAPGKPVEAWYVPVTRESVKEWRELLENPRVGKTGHNLKYDYEVLKQSGITLSPIVFDSMVASYLLNPGARQHGLDALAVEELNHHPIPITDLIGTGKAQKGMSEVPLKEIARYAAEDADLAWQLWEKLKDKIRDDKLSVVLEELELPLIPVLADMELAGVELDSGKLADLRRRVEERLKTLKKEIWRAAGSEFNINSTQQLREVLFEKLKLPTAGIVRKQSGWSTAAAELGKLAGQHPIIDCLSEYRELAKLLNTYIETLPQLKKSETGRVHTSFNQAVTATGRLSSSDPNLQNIPARTGLGQEIRAAFVAARGKKFIKADYAQVELRIAAHISGDEKMLAAFRAGADIHRATAAWVYGIALKDVTDKQRREAKTLNFGVLYGMGPAHFSREAEVSVEEARSFIARYREQYSGITRLIAATIARAEKQGYVETLFGRRRYIPEINSRAPGIRAQAERAAFNFPIQGTAADILKKAMIELDRHLKENYLEVRMVLTVHDELVAEAPEALAAAVAQDMKRIMEETYPLDIPVVVDVAVGSNWRDMKSVLTGQ